MLQEYIRPASLMSLNRFEAFSDGVFAIAVTLLVCEIKAPDPTNATSSEAVIKLLQTFPYVLSYMTSFIVIGMIWINHHALFHFLKRVDRTVLVINLLLLMYVAFISYPTALIGEFGSSLPVVELPDGTQLFAPTIRAIAQHLGWVAQPKFKKYDLSIYGAGLAGLGAAV